MNAAIATEGLTRHFGKTTAVDRLSLNVPEGSIYAAPIRQDDWVLRFSSTDDAPNPRLDDAWLADAELVELTAQPAASFEHRLDLDGFALAGPNRLAEDSERLLAKVGPGNVDLLLKEREQWKWGTQPQNILNFAVASLRDATTYPALRDYLVRTSNRQATYNAIRKLPGISLGEAVRTSWREAQTGTHATVVDAAAMAIDQGYQDALGALVGVLREDDRGQPAQIEHALALVRRYLPIEGDQQELVSWYDAHKSRLRFDPEEKKFVTSGAP